MKRSDGKLSKTVLFNLFVLLGALALETFGAELEAAPLVRKILVFAIAAVNLALRFLTTLPIGAPLSPPPRGPGIVLFVVLVMGLSACGSLRYTCDTVPKPGPTYSYDTESDRTVLVAPCDTDPEAVTLSWPGKVKLRTAEELAPPASGK